MSEQPSERKFACPHPEAVGRRWDDPISEKRHAELQGYLDRWKSQTGYAGRRGPVDGVRLSGADVHWLATQAMALFDEESPLTGSDRIQARIALLSNLSLEGADLSLSTPM